jgi:NitT/TauT family transport system permease protein
VASTIDTLDRELAGLDALDLRRTSKASWVVRAWSATWPKLAAVGLALLFWQTLIWIEWKPLYAFPPPAQVFATLGELVTTSGFWLGVATTIRRALLGVAVALVIGTLLGLAVSQVPLLRRAFGSMIAALQTMPSIVWFPLAILLFQLSETAIFFVVVLGAAPSIANGLISGVDHIPPLWLRAGRVLGARRLSAWRHVVIPAAVPTYIAGLKQGWAFAWRSLMAGELLVIIAKTTSIGVRLHFARELSDADLVMAMMIVVLVIGLIVDLAFTKVELGVRRRRGLIETEPVWRH